MRACERFTRRVPWRVHIGVIMALVVISGCNEFQEMVSTTPDEYVELTAWTTSIPADGESRTTIIARISNAAGSDNRTVTFVTDAGSARANSDVPW